MEKALVKDILAQVPEAKKDGDAFLLGEEIDAAAYVTLGRESLTISRVKSVRLSGSLATIETYKGDRFFFLQDQIVGMKFGSEKTNPLRTAAGFSK